ncbi:unnamed protein product [Mytilus coruscus]|uniref:C-type lectin domain-containing protein n=1 Tax=Mytilus coruscus TaxID=42192 RepID=A0A6J7ZVB3_MYTCO|nr:unnamed protein product [Mytilus coruscus]
MTWRGGYDYCKSKRKRLKYISPSSKAVFADQNPHITSDVTFWTAHQVTNETVIQGNRYYSEFPLDNIKEVSSSLLCVYLVYEADNKRVGWEAGECNDSSIRHPLFCDIAFPTDKRRMTLYAANVTWTDAYTFCEKINSSLLLENSLYTEIELFTFFNSGNWSDTRISTFWTKHTLSDHVTTLEQWPIDKALNESTLDGLYCAYVLLERQVDKNRLGWMSDYCHNSSRSFICEKESEEFYYQPIENYKPVGVFLLFEAQQLSLTDCMVKCNTTTEVGIPCELFVWNFLNSSCQLMNVGEIYVNDSHGYYQVQRSLTYKFAEGLTTYYRFSHTPIIEDYLQTGEDETTVESTTKTKPTEAINIADIKDQSEYSFNSPVMRTISLMVDETMRGNIDFIPQFYDEELSRMKFKNNPPACYTNMIE